MSGGSYSYLCYSFDEGDASEKSFALGEMAERLSTLAPHHPATIYTAELLARLKEPPPIPQSVLDVWKAVEWRDSSDWGDDQLAEVLRRSARLNDPDA